MSIKLENVYITPATGWVDATEEIPEPDPPLTLVKRDGVGALQFSLASYVRGEHPSITINDLQKLLSDFAKSHGMAKGFAATSSSCQSKLLCAMSFNLNEQFFRVWYCSNGSDIMLITYNCKMGLQNEELVDCENMISGLQFNN